MQTIDRNDVILSNPLRPTLERMYSMAFKKIGTQFYSTCPFHDDRGRPNLCVDDQKGLWCCHVCGEGTGGSVIDFVMKKEGVTFVQACEKLGVELAQPPKETVVAQYDYTDENGRLLFQVVRYHPKTFRQRKKTAEGRWEWKMDGVRRVLYRLPDVLKSDRVIVVEGEKDADALRNLNLCATSNVGGAGKWMESYSESLRDKIVILWPDMDDAGRRHADLVEKSLAGFARKVFRIKECDCKDAHDFISASGEKAAVEVDLLIETAVEIRPVDHVPVMSILDMEEEYREMLKHHDEVCVDLGRWIPSLGRNVRPLIPGEMMVILGDTGTGKTALLQSLSVAIHPLPVLLFEMELPGALMFERFLQIDQNLPAHVIQAHYGKGIPANWTKAPSLDHVFTCTKSKLNMDEMERIIKTSETRMNKKPRVVMVDYIGLVQGSGKRYERISDNAEQLKVLAKETGTVVIIASQVGRKEKSESKKSVGEIYLHDGKESGSIENSAGLVLGAWRDDGGDTIKLKILKNTKGRSGFVINCNFNGATMQITEKSKISDADVPVERHVNSPYPE